MATRSRSGSSRPAIKTDTASAADKLAKELSKTLTISDVRGKQKVGSNQSPEPTKLASMRAVNTASQALSNIVQSGWKKSTSSSGGSSKVPLETVNSAAADAAKHLCILRWISPWDIDVERAAVSVLGKLMALEMHNLAGAALEATHPRICQIANGSDESCPVGQTKCLSIPRSSIPTDPVLLNLLSTYLLYALVLASRQEIANPDSIQELSATLHSPSTHSLLSWMPDFRSLPTKHLDSLLTRVYASLTKFCSSSTTVFRKPLPKAKSTTTSVTNPTSAPSPEALFHLRTYALRCLAHTSPGIVEGNTFWDQATKFASLFIRATATPSVSGEHATSVMLTSFAEMVKITETREDKDAFMAVDDDKGKKFVDFCDYWSSIAKRAGDISLLQRINDTLMQNKSSPLGSSPVKSASQHHDTPNSRIPGDKKMLMVEGMKICNTFAQLSLLLEPLVKTNKYKSDEQERDSHLLSLIRSSTVSFQSPEMTYYIKFTVPKSTEGNDDELDRVCAKVKRAVEKVRRLGVKALELFLPSSVPVQTSSTSVDEALSTLLLACVACLRSTLLEQMLISSALCDLLMPLLDTLFVLARVKLKINDSTTFTPAFEFLSQASAILNSITISPEIAPSLPDLDIANCTRCVSGAFYNIAGTLYQAMRYGNAVPFLVESCTLGEKALGLRGSTRQVREGETESREREWKQLEDQLYRRWELLGVCYLKNGDRRKAFECFKKAISMFPYSSSGVVERINTLALGAAFGEDSSAAIKQLVALVDRTTYLGACELFLPPDQISLRSYLTKVVDCQDFSITGALLERQYSSLENSQWKEGVRNVVLHLLKDAFEVYSCETGAEVGGSSVVVMPIRKARVLVQCLEFAYRDSTTAIESVSMFRFENVEEVAGEVEWLCTMQGFGKDTSLAHFSLQYRIAAHLWVALHAHRRSDPDQNTIMTQRSEEACRLLKVLSQGSAASPKTSKVIASPRVVIKRNVGSPKVARIVSPKVTKVARRVPAAPKKAMQVRKVKTKVVEDSVTPRSKPKTGAQPALTNTTLTPPRRSVDGKPATTPPTSFDNFEGFMKLLQHVARILGLLSLILAKAYILDMARKLAQQHLGIKSDEYIISSLDLAHEYVILGKLKRAASIFNLALEVVRNHESSPEISVRFLLRFSESLAMFEDIPASAAVYLEAFELSKGLELEEKGMTTWQRICARARVLEIAATAAHVFATVQFVKGQTSASLEGSLQSLRLWNRATDTMLRLRPSTSTATDNPFKMTALHEALPLIGSGVTEPDKPKQLPIRNTGPPMNELQWRVSEGLLSTIFFLTEIYFLKGSPREADYFARQAAELADQLNAPAMASRAYAKQGEIQMHMGRLQDAHLSLMKAANLLQDMPGLDAADVRRLKVEYNMKVMEGDDPTELFEETMRMIEELDNAFRQFDYLAFGPQRSLGSSPQAKMQPDVLAPALLSSILSQQLWLLRNDVGDHFDAILEKFLSLSYTTATKSAENVLLANLTLHSIYGRFQGDMFLSSLTESTIAVPMCMRSKEDRKSITTSPDIVDALSKAENLLSAYLSTSTATGNVIKVREAAISFVLVCAFRTSLGDRRPNLPSVMAKVLDASACLTLCRDVLEVIDQKFPPTPDDLQWPFLAESGEALPLSYSSTTRKKFVAAVSDSDSDEEDNRLMFESEQSIRDYWMQIRARYQSLLNNPLTTTSSEMADLPSNWTVININITPDKNTLFCCRREGGERSLDPLIFCIPLKGRRDHGDGNDDEEYLTFDGALEELQDIIRSSDDSTKAAINIKPDDEEARSNWWKQRSQLDARLRQLLENIEYCWLGAFKTILSPRSDILPETITDVREQLQRVFLQYLHMKGKKPMNPVHKRTTSHPRSHIPSQLKLDDTFIRSFCALSPKCRDEELEDLVYFILDLYQHHSVPVAISEVDIDQVVIDLRGLLEEHAAKQLKVKKASKIPSDPDEHVFLVLDKNIQGIPWESLPILRGRSVSRIPGVQFLHDRIAFAKCKREAVGQVFNPKLGAALDSRKGYFILNPSGDLGRTEERFRGWASNMKAYGWSGTIGQPISEQEFIDALKLKDFVVYFGHGGGEQYLRSQKIRTLPTCAATMLWGCSSGALRELGDFDRTGTPYNYMLAGCPTLVANLWDVTDKDIDKVCQSVFDKLSLNGKDASGESVKKTRAAVSLVTAVAQSRDSCKLKYLTGAAPVVYGIPFYL